MSFECSRVVLVFCFLAVQHITCLSGVCVVVVSQEQYMFVYDAVLEALKCGDTSVPCTQLRQKLVKLQTTNPDTGKTFCQEEYEVSCGL